MIVDRAWVERNLGFDPIRDPPPISTFAVTTPGGAPTTDLQREIIEWDSESPAGLQFLAFSKATGLSRYKEIKWPKGLAPQTSADPGGGGNNPLPNADVLVVTWTVEEGHALSRVLTPGKDSQNDYRSYTHGYEKLSKLMQPGCPARQAARLGAFWVTQIGDKAVVIFKSDSHMSQDGPKLPNLLLWRQIINEVQPRLVITTGTGGGIGDKYEVGDVVASSIVRFDCISKFKAKAFAHDHYSSLPANTSYFDKAIELFKTNASQLPQENTRDPKITVSAPDALSESVVTTDFFGFDTSDNHYKLQGLGTVSEMGDAVLGLAACEMGQEPPAGLPSGMFQTHRSRRMG